LTFIIHAHDPAAPPTLDAASILALPMVGDVNLFLKGEVMDEDFEVEVEIMIAGEYALRCIYRAPTQLLHILPEPSYRRKGYATEALQLLLSSTTSLPNAAAPETSAACIRRPPLPLPRDRLVVRIGALNKASVALFRSLGFKITKHVEVFDELEMRFVSDSTGASSSMERRDWRTGIVHEVVFH
jgi:RimJ/RimL family protein N-acetyltransferase